MLFSENQREWCKGMINHLFQWNLTIFFRKPFDYVSEGFLDYPSKILKPLDLTTVKNTLYSGYYKNINDFVIDLRLIFENSINFHGESSAISIISKEILKYINEMEKFINLSEDEIWLLNLNNLQLKLENHITQQPPTFCPSLIPTK